MLNKVIFYALSCTLLVFPMYAMEHVVPEVTAKPGARVTQSSKSNRDVRDQAPLSLQPYTSFPPAEMDQTLLELLILGSRVPIDLNSEKLKSKDVSSTPLASSGDPAVSSPSSPISKDSMVVPKGHVLYNNVWFGCKSSDNKCYMLGEILKKNKRTIGDEPSRVIGAFLPKTFVPRSHNTFSAEGVNPESALASYVIYVNDDLCLEDEKSKHPLELMFSVTKYNATVEKQKTVKPQLSTPQIYLNSVTAIFQEGDWSETDAFKTLDTMKSVLYSYPFFVSGEALLDHLRTLKARFPTKIEGFLKHWVLEVSQSGVKNMRLDNDDIIALGETLKTPVAAPLLIQNEPCISKFKLADLMDNKRSNTDNYVDVLNLNAEYFGDALWARDHFLWQRVVLMDIKKSQHTELAWYSTQTSRWVALNILLAQNSHTRQEMFSKFLDVGVYLLDSNNIHGAMHIIVAFHMSSMTRVMETTPNKDKQEKDPFEDPRWLRLRNVASYPNADIHFKKAVSDRFLSYSAMAGKLSNWYETFEQANEGHIEILTGIAKVVEGFLGFQKRSFLYDDIKLQYIKLVCGIGYCDTGEIRAETLETISSLIKEYPIEEQFDPSIPRTFADLQDNLFSNFLINKECKKEVILELFRKSIYSGDDLIKALGTRKTPNKKIEKLVKLGIPERTAKSILDAQYAGVIDPQDYKPVPIKGKEVKKRKKSTSKSTPKK